MCDIRDLLLLLHYYYYLYFSTTITITLSTLTLLLLLLLFHLLFTTSVEVKHHWILFFGWILSVFFHIYLSFGLTDSTALSLLGRFGMRSLMKGFTSCDYLWHQGFTLTTTLLLSSTTTTCTTLYDFCGSQTPLNFILWMDTFCIFSYL